MKPKHPTSPLARRGQRGAALLMAMVIVTLVATISSSMVWQQWRAVQVEGAERVRSQATWVLSGALDWARLILREDARNGGPDHLGEPWAIPLAEARLSTFLAADSNNTGDDDAPEAFLSGKVEDVTSHYNLRNVVSPEGDIVAEELASLKRLCENAGLPPTLGDGLAQALRRAMLAALSVQSGNPAFLEKLGGEEARQRAPLVPQTFDQLIWLGIDAATLERLRPYLTLLPEQTLVNVNTAPKEVIAAAVENLDLARAARLVQTRQRAAFKTTDEVRSTLGAGSWNMGRLDIKSSWFEVRGRLRLEDNVIEQRHLVQRSGDEVTVRHQSRFSGIDRGADPPPDP
ncbi:MAG: type II secretion system minor pseudopilin GspK [Proteobacteria bacterium]|uniref:type II secretion system minor pseudopilin GspK n=1 Tax=Aquabacterium sp. TaxID=1872578 RepID=UPI0035C71EA4|nr:type II secretion system minor pseudopilin GspK [Pseudomonadota bacterium]